MGLKVRLGKVSWSVAVASAAALFGVPMSCQSMEAQQVPELSFTGALVGRTSDVASADAIEAEVGHAFTLTGSTATTVANAGVVEVTVTERSVVAAPAPVKQFRARPGDGKVILDWANPDDGSITKYEVRQRLARNGGRWGAWSVIAGSGAQTTSHVVSGLTNGQRYLFRVRAVNEDGEGGRSPAKGATPMDVLTVAVADARIVEGDAGQTEMEFVVTINGEPVDDVKLRVTATAGEGSTATSAEGAGQDFIPMSKTIVFDAHGRQRTRQTEVNDLRKTVRVQVVGDHLAEGDETFQLRLDNLVSNDARVVLTGGGENLRATGVISDDDAAPVLSSMSDQSGKVGKPLSFIASATDADGDAIVYSWVRKSGPSLPQGTRLDTAALSFTPATAGTYVMRVTATDGNGNSASQDVSITVAAKDRIAVPRTLSVTEGTDRTATVSITTGSALGEEVTFSVSYGGTATGSNNPSGNDDYDNDAVTEITFAANDTAKDIVIPIHDDNEDESNKTIQVSIAAKSPPLPAGFEMGNATTTITISDDDATPLLSALADVSLSAGEAVNIVASARDGDGDTISYLWSRKNGERPALPDNTDLSNARLSFTPTQAGTYTMTVTANDGHGNMAREDVVIRVSTTVEPAIVWVYATLQVTEGRNNNAMMLIELSKALAERATFKISYGGTATAGVDYSNRVSSITFNATDTINYILIPLIDDDRDEDNETITVTLTPAEPLSSVSLGDAKTTVLTIADDDATPVLAEIEDVWVKPGQVVSIKASATDADGDTISYAWTRKTSERPALPDNTDLSNARLSFTPTQAGTYTMTVTANDGHGNMASEDVVITVNPVEPATVWVYATLQVMEGRNNNAMMLIELSKALGERATFNVSYGGTATAGVDYRNRVTSITFNATDTINYILIPLIDDDRDEDNETITVTLSPVEPLSSVSLENAKTTVLTIADDDASPVLADMTDVSVTAGQAVNITASASDADGDTISYAWTRKASETPALPSNTDLSNARLSFTPTQSGTYTMTVTANDGHGNMATEDVVITVSTPVEPATVSLPPSLQVTEGTDSNAVVTITSSRPLGETATFNVSYGGTATADVDYDDAVASITFNATDTSKAITIPLTDDDRDEDNETITVTIAATGSLPTGSLGNATTTVTIVDDDASPVLADMTDVSVTAGQVVNITASASDADGDTISYVWTRKASETPALPDNTDLSNALLAFTPTQAGTYTMTVTANDGHGNTDSEDVVITVSEPATLSVQANRYWMEGTNNNAMMLFKLSKVLGETATFNVSYGGTATAGVDYSNTVTSITFSPTDTTEYILIPLIDDDRDEDNETITVTLAPAEPLSTVSLGNAKTTVMTIIDDDASPVLVDITDVALTAGQVVNITASATDADGDTISYAWTRKANETPALPDKTDLSNARLTFTPSQAGTYTMTVTANDGHGNADTEDVVITVSEPATVSVPTTLQVTEGTDGNAVVTITASKALGETATFNISYGGTATADVDYDDAVTSITFNATDTSKAITIPLTDDDRDEDNETITVTIAATGSLSAGSLGNTTTTVTVVDDDASPVLADIRDVSVTAGQAVNITASATDADGDTISYAWTRKASETPALPNNTNLSNARLSFTPAQAGTYTMTVTANDGHGNTDSEDVVITVSEPVTVSVPTTLQVTEGTDSNAVVTITASKPLGQTATFNISYGGTATADVDYDDTTTSITFNATDTSKAITIPLTDDDRDEDNETITVTIAATGSLSAGSPGNTTTTVIMVDDDATPVLSTISDQSGKVGKPLSVTASATDADADPITYIWTRKSGPTLPQDITLNTATLDFTPATDGTYLMTVTASDGTNSDSQEVTITVAPKDRISVPGALSVTEGTDSNATVTITTGSPLGEEVTFTVSYGGTATGSNSPSGNDDYDNDAVTRVSLAASEISKSFTIPLFDDNQDEGNKTIVVTIAPQSLPLPAGFEMGNATITITISDDDGDGAVLEKPRKVRAIPSEGSVTLYWEHQYNYYDWNNPGSAPITKWQIQQKMGNRNYGPWTDITNAATPIGYSRVKTHTVTGLTSDTLYGFRIRAIAGTVTGAASDEVSATTPKKKPVAPKLTVTIRKQPARPSYRPQLYQHDLTWTVADNDPHAMVENAESILGWIVHTRRKIGGEWRNTHSPEHISDPEIRSHTFSFYNVNEHDTQVEYRIQAYGKLSWRGGVQGQDSGPLSNRATVMLVATTGPAKPTGVTAKGGNRSVTLRWDNPGDAHITKWQIQQKYLGPGAYSYSPWRDINGSGAATTSHTVTGLTNSRKGYGYSFRIRAVAGTVAGTASNVVQAVPSPTVAPKLKVTMQRVFGDRGCNRVHLSWNFGSYPHTIVENADSIVGWTINYKIITYYADSTVGEVRSREGKWIRATTKTATTPHERTVAIGKRSEKLILCGLDDVESRDSSFAPGVRYRIRANGQRRGSEEIIYGPWSNETSVRVPYANRGTGRILPGPELVEAYAGNQKVTLSWRNPGYAISKIQIQQRARRDSYGPWRDIHGSGPNTTSHTVTGLTNGREYGFRIRAVPRKIESLLGASVTASNAVSARPTAVPELTATTRKKVVGVHGYYVDLEWTTGDVNYMFSGGIRTKTDPNRDRIVWHVAYRSISSSVDDGWTNSNSAVFPSNSGTWSHTFLHRTPRDGDLMEYRVRGERWRGRRFMSMGGWSNIVTVRFGTTPEPVPEPVSVSLPPSLQVTEGTDSNAVVTIKASKPLGQAASFNIAYGGTATVGVDYGNAVTPISFLKGETSKTITISLTDDDRDEDNETITVAIVPIDRLSAHNGISLGNAKTTVTIVDDDASPVLTDLADVSVAAGQMVDITASATDADGDTISYAWTRKASETPALPDNTDLSNARLTFTPTQVGTYTMTVTANDGHGNTASEDVVIAVTPSVSLPSTLQVEEGTDSNVVVTVSASRALGETATFNISYDGTATADVDYDDAVTSITFNATDTSKVITIPLTDDDRDEDNETIMVTLEPAGSLPTGFSLGNVKTTVTIVDDDASPVLADLADVSVISGQVLTITASATDADGDTISYAWTRKADETPALPDNIDPSNAQFTFTPTQVGTYTMTVTASDGHGNTATEDVVITVFTPDEIATISLPSTLQVEEGTDSNAVVTVSASRALGETATFNVIYDGTAIVDVDYDDAVTSITFNATDTSKVITIPLTDDDRDEDNETIMVTLEPAGSLPTGFFLGNVKTTVTIVDDDASPVLTDLADVFVTAGQVVNIMASAIDADGDTIGYAWTRKEASGTPALPDNTDLSNARLSFTPPRAGTYTMVVTADDGYGNTGNTTVVIAVAARLRDGEVTLSVTNAQVAEGNNGQTNMVFTVTLNGSPSANVKLTATALAGPGSTATATKGKRRDFIPLSKTIKFAANAQGDNLKKTISVKVLGDYSFEADETFLLRLDSLETKDQRVAFASGGENMQVVGTISNDDVRGVSQHCRGERLLNARRRGRGNTQYHDIGFADYAAFVGENQKPVSGVRVNRARIAITADAPADRDITFKITYADGHVESGGEDNEFAAANEWADYDPTPRTVTLPAGETKIIVPIPVLDDDLVEDHYDMFTMCLEPTAPLPEGYILYYPSVQVAIDDDDATDTINYWSGVSVSNASVQEGSGAQLAFKVKLKRLTNGGHTAGRIDVKYATRDRTAVAGADYTATSGMLRFAPGETEKTIYVAVLDDDHDEGSETMELVISEAIALAPDGSEDVYSLHNGRDGIRGIGTIVNTDPIPAAWLSRFGSTVADQALDAISDRIAAEQTPGLAGKLAGQTLPHMTFGDSGKDDAVVSDTTRSGSALAEVIYRAAVESRSMTIRDVLLGSAFSLTGGTDTMGGNLTVWGRAAYSGFDGKEDTLSLDGKVTTGLLGLDYARQRWMLGLGISHSVGNGSYSDSTDGKIETSLTAALPYGSWQATEWLKLWGALGYGMGEMTLKSDSDTAINADLNWSMAAIGARAALLDPDGKGLALDLISDALWTRTASEKVAGLAASESDVTRLRLGLEGTWQIPVQGSGELMPKLSVGTRYDGGDAETGFGAELGGGITWTHPGIGLTLDVDGRTLLAHEAEGLKDWGFSAGLAFDPKPSTDRGFSLSVGQDWGGEATGGIDALFASDPLAQRTGTKATSRWTLEAAYGLPAFSEHFTGSPYVGLALAVGSRDYNIGWRLTAEADAIEDLSFDLKATRSESNGSQPDHRVGFELRRTW